MVDLPTICDIIEEATGLPEEIKSGEGKGRRLIKIGGCSVSNGESELASFAAAAYDWTDFEFGHDFHETKQGIRFTISESARREVLDRLLALNHERYQQEVEMGLHDKGRKKTSRESTPKSRPNSKTMKTETRLGSGQGDLF